MLSACCLQSSIFNATSLNDPERSRSGGSSVLRTESPGFICKKEHHSVSQLVKCDKFSVGIHNIYETHEWRRAQSMCGSLCGVPYAVYPSLACILRDIAPDLVVLLPDHPQYKVGQNKSLSGEGMCFINWRPWPSPCTTEEYVPKSPNHIAYLRRSCICQLDCHSVK